MPFRSDARFTPPGRLIGHAFHSEDPERIWHIGLFLNENLIAHSPAQSASQPDFTAAAFAGFRFHIAPDLLTPEDWLEVWILNTAHLIARFQVKDLSRGALGQARDPAPGRITASQGKPLACGAPGRITASQGLTLRGRIEDAVTSAPHYEILAREGGHIVGRNPIWRWQHIADEAHGLGRALGFELFLDPDLADGRPHRIEVETSTGRALQGSPIDVLALPDMLRDALTSHIRASRDDPAARQFDRLLADITGTAMPLQAYAKLYPKLRPAPFCDPPQPIGTDGYARKIGAGDWLLCQHRDITPLADFCAHVTQTLAAQPKPPGLILGDLAITLADGQILPLLFSSFDLERLLEQGHAALSFALPRTAFRADAASLADLLLGYLLPPESPPRSRGEIWHLPHPSGMIEARHFEASCSARAIALEQAITGRIGKSPVLPRGSEIVKSDRPAPKHPLFPALHLRRPLRENSISVIIPSRDRPALLAKAYHSLRAMNPGLDLDILIIDHASREAETHQLLRQIEGEGGRVMNYKGPFNYAKMNNIAAAKARHPLLCFLNNDVEFDQSGVLEELARRLSDPSIGATGPLMQRPSGQIQHGGVVLGPFHMPVHAFEDRLIDDPGPAEMLRVAYEPSALTAALFLTRTALFQNLGGFDAQHFPVNFNDVDYCLRLWANGYRTVFTPHRAIIHLESASRGPEGNGPAQARLEREAANLRAKWRDALLDDPQYHPLFAPGLQPWRALTTSHRAPEARSAAPRLPHLLPAWI